MDCIVNVTQNWGIGKDGGLLVSIRTDLRRFRALTTGKTVIYGRKTLLTFPHARPLRTAKTGSSRRHPAFSVPGAAVFPSLCGPAGSPAYRPADSLCLIGGASVYARCCRGAAACCSRRPAPTCLPTGFSPIWTGSLNWRCTDTGPLRRTAAIASAI